MAVHNADIACVFNRLANLLEIEGADAFRIRAFRRAPQTIEDLPNGAAEMIARDEDLAELPGIGVDLSAKIRAWIFVVRPPRLRPTQRSRLFFWDAGGTLMHVHERAVDHLNLAVVRLDDGIHQAMPEACLAPAIEALVGRRVGTSTFR